MQVDEDVMEFGGVPDDVRAYSLRPGLVSLHASCMAGINQ